jgi:hypothetical protein
VTVNGAMALDIVDNKLIANLGTKGAVLREAQVMRV